MGTQDMNHIEYKIFNSIQVIQNFMNDWTLLQTFLILVIKIYIISNLNFFMNQDPANEQTENHYKGLQAKVADAVRLETFFCWLRYNFKT